MSESPAPRKSQQLISYLALRKLIGTTGVLLPVILPLSCIVIGENTALQDSISDYYYTEGRNFLVGILFVLGFFLLTYRGYDKEDDRFANFGFAFALGVAMFPCQNEVMLVRIIHFGSALMLFIVFIWFSLKLFTRSVKEAESTPERLQRNTRYIVSGWIMIACIVCIGISLVALTEEQRAWYNTTFWFESVALWAFGYSWLTKGKFLWKDEPVS